MIWWGRAGALRILEDAAVGPIDELAAATTANAGERDFGGEFSHAMFDLEPSPIEHIPEPALVVSHSDCLEQLLAAFCDIADLDDIHQAARRIALVQDWIERQTIAAAHDSILFPMRLAS